MHGETFTGELTLLEQVHIALGFATKLEDFNTISCGMLVDPNAFGFSRAFLFTLDEISNSFHGTFMLGGRTSEEYMIFREEMLHEASRLDEQIGSLKGGPPPRYSFQESFDLRCHSLWIRLFQAGEEMSGYQRQFREVVLERSSLPHLHLLEQAAAHSHAALVGPAEQSIDGLNEFLETPVLAGRLVTKNGVHAIIVVDRKYQDSPLSPYDVHRFQWFLNHCSIALENVKLVEELRETTRKLQEMDRLKSSFLSTVSHELRTPLTTIIGFVHLIAEEKVGPLLPVQRDLLERVRSQSVHLSSMVNDLLEIAEVEAGGMMDVNLAAVDPLPALLNVLPKVELRRGTKPIAIEPIIRQRVTLIRTDQHALERIYYHLLDNAVKFTREGRVTIEFQQVGNELEITIADTGIGMSEESLRRIFEYFYQVDSRLERVYGGMGIGLAVVRLLLQATGGQIRAVSVPGQGSRFTLCYPVVTET